MVGGSCNQRSWLYRIRPSVTHEPFHPLDFASEVFSGDFERALITPNQLRWRPFSVPDDPVDFVRGLFTICGAGRQAGSLPLASSSGKRSLVCPA